MSGPPGRVVLKLGGSLLDWPGLADRLRDLLLDHEQAGDCVALVVGGGAVADVVRDLDRRHGLGDQVAHALALRVMDLTAEAVAAIVPDLALTDDFAGVHEAWAASQATVFAPRRLLLGDEAGALPASWDVTSDSIAAWAAGRLGAGLVLLKSAPLPPGTGRETAARLGLVDPHFPAAARPLRWVSYWNLRDPAAGPVPLPSP